MNRRLLFALFAISISTVGCRQSATVTAPTPTPLAVSSPTATPAPAAAGSLELQTVASGLQFQDLVIGTGQKPGFNQTVRIAYVGKLANGTTFDKGVDDFKLGVGDVIKGWDQGIVGGGGVEPMREGGKRKLVIPPQLGYGDKIMSTIPANSTLIFEVELLRVNKPGFGR
jgi:peptidylprolyl isomerase